MVTTGVVLLLMTGCSEGSAGTDGPSGVGKKSAPQSSVDLRLPLQDYLFSDSELNTVKQAMRRLAQDCMRQYKVSYDFAPPAPAVGPRSLMDRRYGLTDARMARTSGYHLGERDPRTHPVKQPSPPVGKALTVLSGSKAGPEKANGVTVPVGGCAGKAERHLARDGRLGSGDLAQDLNGKSFTDTKADRRVTEVFRAWSQCMKAKGFSYPDPLTLMNDSRFQGNLPVPEEIAVAKADVDCKEQADVVSVWFAVETAYQNVLIKKNKSALDVALKTKEDQLALAGEVISAE